MRIVMFSGGVGSWATAKRVADRHGTDGLVLLFADTRVEDPDLYRFRDEAAANIGGELVVVADGRTPFEVFHDDRFLGNQRLANCSKYLKIKPCRDWLEANCDPQTTTVYVGIDWTEQHRIPANRAGWAPYRVEFPMTDPPYMDKRQMLEALDREGIARPVAYAEGFPHNNCGQQGCVRGGQAYWPLVLRARPEAFRRSERQEQELRDHLGADVAILRDRTRGEVRPLTLRDFRERVETQGSLLDGDEWGGCGCFTGEEAA
jgi:hypothetical protein